MALRHFYKRKSRDNSSRIEKILGALSVICLVLVFILIINNAKSIILWMLYEKNTTAIVTSIEVRTSYAQAYPLHQYKISYTYDIEGCIYENTTSWIIHTLDVEEGNEINIRYDDNNYALSISEFDVAGAQSNICSIWLLVIVIGWSIWLGSHLATITI